MTRAWLHHTSSFAFPVASPVKVLNQGPKRARVQLVHKLRWNRKWYPAGSTRYVPVYALGEFPDRWHLVGVGNGRFVPAATPKGRAAIERWRS